jgi:hypothetical protein
LSRLTIKRSDCTCLGCECCLPRGAHSLLILLELLKEGGLRHALV